MAYSVKERIAHVYRRLGLGSYPDLIASTETVEDAIDRALDLDYPAPQLLEMEVPLDRETANDIANLAAPVQSWLTSMVQSPRPIEERLVWFWHDHFATAIQKVRIPYLLWRQHLTIRDHATGGFDGLLKAIAVDPAMLRYLDGSHNRVGFVNENFAREVMELHTLGTGNYSQTDITEAAKALTGWIINVPYARQTQRFLSEYAPWESAVIPDLHYEGTTTILGQTGSHSMDDVLDILLENPATAQFITAKLWAELVGTPPDEATVAQHAQVFRAGYSTLALAESIARDPAFIADDAIRSKVRTPVERLVAIAQGMGNGQVDERLGYSLHGMAYLPFNPPSPAGYAKGRILLGPHQMIHAFDLLAVANVEGPTTSEEILTKIGLIDVSDGSRKVLDQAPDVATRIALAVNTPEFALV